ncbi:hypothetical protein MY4038_007864 [Beauveria bassiana]
MEDAGRACDMLSHTGALPGSVNDGAAETQPGKRRRVNGIACDNCRAKKVASQCNRARPVCARCTRLNVECEYASTSPEETRSMALKRRIDELQQELSESSHSALFHHTVLTLFQPFQGNVEELCLRSFTSPDATPSAIYNAS